MQADYRIPRCLNKLREGLYFMKTAKGDVEIESSLIGQVQRWIEDQQLKIVPCLVELSDLAK